MSKRIVYEVSESSSGEPFVDVYSDGSVSVTSKKFDSETKDCLEQAWKDLFGCFSVLKEDYGAITGGLFNEQYPKALLMLCVVLGDDISSNDYSIKYYGSGAMWTVEFGIE